MLRDVVFTSFARAFSLLTGVVSLMITARWLGPEGRGEVIAVTVLMSMLGTFGHFSLGPVWVRKANQKEEGWLNQAVSFALLNTLVVFCLLVVLFCLFHFFQPSFISRWNDELLILGLLFPPFVMLDYYMQQILTVLNKYNSYSIFLVWSRLIVVLMLPLLLFFGLSGKGFLLSTLTGLAVVSICSLRLVFKQQVGLSLPSFKMYLGTVFSSGYAQIISFGALLYSSGGIIQLNFMKGAAEAGEYQVAYQLLTIMLVAGQSASTILFGRVSESNDKKSWLSQKKLIHFVMVFYAFLTVIAFYVGPMIINFIVGDNFVLTASAFKVLVIASFFLAFNYLMVHQWYVLGKQKILAFITVTFCVLSGVLNMFLIPIYHLQAVALCFLLICFLNFIANVFLYIKCNNDLIYRSELD